MDKGDFVKFKIGYFYHYGMIDEIKGNFAEVSYNSKKRFMYYKDRFSLGYGLDYFGDVELSKLTKLDYPNFYSL